MLIVLLGNTRSSANYQVPHPTAKRTHISTVVDTKFGPPDKKNDPPTKKVTPPDKKKWPPPPEKWSMPSPDNYKNLDEIILNPTYNN